MLRRLLPLLAAVMVAAACGVGDKRPEPTPTKEPFIDITPHAVPTSDASLAKALLSAADLGDGWTVLPPTNPTVAATYYCGEALSLPPLTASVTLVHESRRVLVIQGLSEFEDEAASRAAAAEFADAHVNCDAYISTDGDRRTDYRIEEFDVVELGDEGYFERSSSASFGGAEVELHAVMIRRGSLIIVLGAVYPDEPQAGEILEFARAALSKYERFAD